MASADQAADPVLSVIVPPYSERENIARLAGAIIEAVGDTPVEILVVDDNSPDGTAAMVAELAATDARVHVVSRERKQGLSSAVFAGVSASSGAYICIMDADFSHDPEEIPSMLAKAQAGYDVVVGSRYARGAVFVGQPLTRRVISYALNLGARLVLQIGTRDVLTGYALVRRDVLATVPTRFSAGGFVRGLESELDGVATTVAEQLGDFMIHEVHVTETAKRSTDFVFVSLEELAQPLLVREEDRVVDRGPQEIIVARKGKQEF